MRVLLDSSALAKRYIAEPGWPQVRALLARADELLLSILAYPEVIAALSRRRREGRIGDEQYEHAKRRATSDLNDATIVGLDAEVMQRTVLCLEREALRASDAIHIASAIEAGVDRFVSADRRQCEAARATGLTVEEIPSEDP